MSGVCLCMRYTSTCNLEPSMPQPTPVHMYIWLSRAHPCYCALRRYEAASEPHTGFRPRNCHPQSGVGSYFEASELYKARVMMNTMPLSVLLDTSVWDVPVVSRHTHTHT